MPRLIIHIGIPKTGSSAIQSALARNSAALLERNMVYPLGRHHEAATAGMVSSGNGGRLGKLLGVRSQAKNRVTVDEVDAEMRQASAAGRDLLYSSEALCAFDEASLAGFVEAAGRIGFRVQVAAYVRSIADLAISSYHQQLKRHGYAGSLGDYLATFTVAGMRQVLSLHRLLDPSQVVLRNYDGCAGGLLADFFTHVLGFDSLQGFALENARVNRSLTGLEVAVMREINAQLQDGRLGRVASDALIYGDRGAPYRHEISQPDLDALAARFAPLVERVNALGLKPALTMASAALAVSDARGRELSESEAVFARLFAGLMKHLERAPPGKGG